MFVALLFQTCRGLHSLLKGSLGLWRNIVLRILMLSPSYDLSETFLVAGVDKLRIAAQRSHRVQTTIHLGGVKHSVARIIDMASRPRMVEMVLVVGTRYFIYLDEHGAVHMAYTSTGCVVFTWEYAHAIETIVRPRLDVWESAVHGLILSIHVWIMWSVAVIQLSRFIITSSQSY
jgi:hypothetical protein